MGAREDAELTARVRHATGARAAYPQERVQGLWSGYGEIRRYRLEDATVASVMVKDVRYPAAVSHPRGWGGGVSDRRKRRSYEVERAWYADFAPRLDPSRCRLPRCFAAGGDDHGGWMILEDLDAAGFPDRRERLDFDGAVLCLRWLAELHAAFVGTAPDGLWPVGSYWHLATRQEEWAAIEDPAIRRTAAEVDRRLNAARFHTLVHGDAKVANFCFAADGGALAAVDFQYVGGGCGMKDVAYFIGSCLDEEEQEHREADLLDAYFDALREALRDHHPDVEAAALEAEWRDLFPLAQADFYRFLVGWSPAHWKIHDYSRRVALDVVRRLDPGPA